METISEWIVKKTRKEYECNTCGMNIPSGSSTRNQKISTDDGIITVRNCVDNCSKRTSHQKLVYSVLTGAILFVGYLIWSGM